MNVMTIDQMAAGPELDALVAEKVVGLHVEWRSGQPLWVGKDLPGSPYVLDDGLFGHTIEPYSTDIAAAWQIVEKLKLSLVPNNVGWIVSPHHLFEGPIGEAPTAPLAICRAALKMHELLKG